MVAPLLELCTARFATLLASGGEVEGGDEDRAALIGALPAGVREDLARLLSARGVLDAALLGAIVAPGDVRRLRVWGGPAPLGLGSASRRCAALQVLSIRGARGTRDVADALEAVRPGALVELVVLESEASARALGAAAAAAPRLEILRVDSSTQLGDAAVALLVAGAPNLVDLCLCGQARLSFAGVAAVLDGCYALERLSLRASPSALDGAGAYAREPRAVRRLTHIDVGLVGGLAPAFIARLCGAGPVRFLDVSENARVDGTFLDRLWPAADPAALACEALVVSWCDDLCGAALARAVARMPALERLDAKVSGITDGDLARAFRGGAGARLRVLRVSRSGVGDAALAALAEVGTGRLETLECDWCDVSDAATLAILRASPRLATLNVAGCKRLTDAVLDAAAAARVTYLDLTYVNGISLTGAALSRRAPRLTVVDYYNEAHLGGALLEGGGGATDRQWPRAWGDG